MWKNTRPWLRYIEGIDGAQAGASTDCGTCLDRCPQHIDIPSWMTKIADTFEA